MPGISDIGEILGVGEGVAQSITGAIDAKKDKAALNALRRPFYQIQNEYLQNKNIAEQTASGGLPSATKNFLTSESQRGLGAGINATLQEGGSPNDVSKLYDTYNTELNRIGSEDANAHLKNIEYFMNANKDLAGQKNIQFGVNELQPYEEKLSQLTESLKADKSNIWGGINTVVGSLTGAQTANQNADLNKSMINKNNQGADYYAKLFADQNGSIRDPVTLPSIASQGSSITGNTDSLLQGGFMTSGGGDLIQAASSALPAIAGLE